MTKKPVNKVKDSWQTDKKKIFAMYVTNKDKPHLNWEKNIPTLFTSWYDVIRRQLHFCDTSHWYQLSLIMKKYLITPNEGQNSTK